MKRYSKYIKPYWIFFVLAPMMMCVEVYCDVQIPYFSAQIINEGVQLSDVNAIIYYSAIMLVHVILAVASGVAAAYFATKASVNFSCDLREDVFKRIQDFSFANIDKFSTGSLVTRLTNDINQLQQLVVMCLRMLFRAPGMLFGALVMSYSINQGISIIFMILVPILAIVIYTVLMLSYKKFTALQQKIDGLNSRIQEVLVNIRVIKALNREEYEDDKFQDVNSDLKNATLKANRITILQMPIMTILVNFATIAILWFGSLALKADDIQIGDISTLITYLTQILMSVNMFAMIFLQSSRSIVSGKRILEVLNTEVDTNNNESKYLDKTVNSGDIVFENVFFKYYKDNKENVLSNINVHIKSGETIGIIGSTGCGKTSFVHLIPRLYDIDSGNIFVDGVNVKDYSVKNLRDGVSVVLQNNLLFSGSIKDNLQWGDKNAKFEDMVKVANWSASDEFINNFNDGYDTRLDQGGLNLSGGQKQRLCIARAMLKNPKILILDDSTSAVDTATEQRINSHLHGEFDNITKIIIAQRVSSVVNATKIIVMNEGKIEAIGSHQELLKSCITYQEIHNSQMDKGGK
ncbi:MAG: ABC transporter ATP-binding protein [Clostridia bacterium]